MLLSLGTNKTSSEIRGDRQQANSLRASRQSHAATVSESLAGQAPHPDAAGGRLAEMNFMAPDGKRHRFIIFALMYPRARSRPQAQAAEKLQKLRVFLIDAEDLDGFTGVQFGERQGAALPAQLRQATEQGHAVRAGTLRAEPLQEQRFDIGRDPVLEPLGLLMRL